MSAPGLKLFLSTVTSEFRSYRDVLRADLKGPLLEIKVQEDFIHLGRDTLSLLDDYIAVCDGVIHLIGAATGACPAPVSVQRFLQRSDVATRFQRVEKQPASWKVAAENQENLQTVCGEVTQRAKQTLK